MAFTFSDPLSTVLPIQHGWRLDSPLSPVLLSLCTEQAQILGHSRLQSIFFSPLNHRVLCLFPLFLKQLMMYAIHFSHFSPLFLLPGIPFLTVLISETCISQGPGTIFYLHPIYKPFKILRLQLNLCLSITVFIVLCLG